MAQWQSTSLVMMGLWVRFPPLAPMAPKVLSFGSFDSIKINRRNVIMGKNNFLSLIPSTTKSGKMKTFAGKTTARVTALFPQSDGSLYKITRRINKDFSISDIIEHRHK